MADEKVEFKYKAEYAKSNRSSCKGCKTSIEKGVLRLALLVQVCFMYLFQNNTFFNYIY